MISLNGEVFDPMTIAYEGRNVRVLRLDGAVAWEQYYGASNGGKLPALSASSDGFSLKFTSGSYVEGSVRYYSPDDSGIGRSAYSYEGDMALTIPLNLHPKSDSALVGNTLLSQYVALGSFSSIGMSGVPAGHDVHDIVLLADKTIGLGLYKHNGMVIGKREKTGLFPAYVALSASSAKISAELKVRTGDVEGDYLIVNDRVNSWTYQNGATVEIRRPVCGWGFLLPD